MIIIALLAVVGMFQSRPANAELRLGFATGPKFTLLSSDPRVVSELDDRGGFQFSGFADARLTPVLSVRLAIGYSRRSFNENTHLLLINGERLEPETADTRLDYVSVSSLAKIQSTRPTGVLPYVLVGPRYDVLVDISGGLPDYSRGDARVPLNIPEDYSTGLFGATLGLGLQFGHSFVMEVYYEVDFSNVSNTELIDLRMRTLGFVLGGSFEL